MGLTCFGVVMHHLATSLVCIGEGSHTSSRVIFLTDLCSTVDSANDERKLLDTIKSNAERGIYTTVVGIGMVSLENDISTFGHNLVW